ncbi:hypothetical protein D3C76_1521900 [compost metagenome]
MDMDPYDIIHQALHFSHTVIKAHSVHHDGMTGIVPDTDRSPFEGRNDGLGFGKGRNLLWSRSCLDTKTNI